MKIIIITWILSILFCVLVDIEIKLRFKTTLNHDLPVIYWIVLTILIYLIPIVNVTAAVASYKYIAKQQ